MLDEQSLSNHPDVERSQNPEITKEQAETPSVKRGRFHIENAKTEVFSSIKKGRFSIYHSEASLENKLIFEIIERQSEQIDIMFDMINSMSGNEKLFHKEFMASSAAVCEKIERLRSLFGNFGSG
ncbi:uncharacterized protein VICG_00921 [Vittaforma corneae ATCC 50505]|uniref:Uncharacterized protein n=1 Tax=Vittaforma corneae (strain ATCC 50505) TaxID=993615 RepID=L2GP24_VITCO|nr:uncharacterized protein VICG_00921 [Vittaforma corneae ATCC 50505]ELA42072.1 hypothetical protein VICG_00921 [Vittaforma corneae ATCC 50505]